MSKMASRRSFFMSERDRSGSACVERVADV
jgi:hypothetical protein